MQTIIGFIDVTVANQNGIERRIYKKIEKTSEYISLFHAWASNVVRSYFIAVSKHVP